MNRTVLKAMLAVMLVAFVGSAYAGPPPKGFLCHNIGGPVELGANCDGATGLCEVVLENGQTLIVPQNFFLGIVIGTDSPSAIAAHLAHGDGFTPGPIFDPPLHLASTGQNHQAANVECIAERVIPQPTEPGN